MTDQLGSGLGVNLIETQVEDCNDYKETIRDFMSGELYSGLVRSLGYSVQGSFLNLRNSLQEDVYKHG